MPLANTITIVDLGALHSSIQEAQSYVDETMAMVALTIQKIVAAGRLLIVSKGDQRHGEWHDWLAANCPMLTKYTATRWMKLAEFDGKRGADLENASSVTQAYRLAGILPELDGGTGESKSYGAASFITHLMQATNQLNARISNCPVEQWSSQDRGLLKQRLAPLNALYEKL
ncbi:MAG: hypothetical protein ABSE62_04940 [Chthoniobacteraceae bacterium]